MKYELELRDKVNKINKELIGQVHVCIMNNSTNSNYHYNYMDKPHKYIYYFMQDKSCFACSITYNYDKSKNIEKEKIY